MRHSVHNVYAAFASLLVTLSLVASEPPLKNDDVANLSKLGIGDAAIIAKIKQAPEVSFRLEIADLTALKNSGVTGAVIAAMLDRAAVDAKDITPGSGAAVTEPDYIGLFCSRNPNTGELTPLERQTGAAGVSVKAMGFGGAETYIQVAGERSPVRFKEGDGTGFVVLAATQNTNPQDIAQLFVLDVVDGKRRLPVGRAASMGISGRSVATESQIPITAARYGKSSFLITPSEPLGPGEYSFASTTPGVGFCFGVDANPGHGTSRFERVLPLRHREILPLGITERGFTIDSVEIIGWPKDTAKPDATGEILVVFRQSNRASRDYKCEYVVTALDDSGAEVGAGKRTVGLEEGEVDDTARVGVKGRISDLSKATQLRIRAVPQPDL